MRNASRVIYNERKLQRLTDEEITRLQSMLAVNIAEVPRRFKLRVYDGHRA